MLDKKEMFEKFAKIAEKFEPIIAKLMHNMEVQQKRNEIQFRLILKICKMKLIPVDDIFELVDLKPADNFLYTFKDIKPELMAVSMDIMLEASLGGLFDKKETE